jgi:hypothetical protein
MGQGSGRSRDKDVIHKSNDKNRMKYVKPGGYPVLSDSHHHWALEDLFVFDIDILCYLVYVL